MCISRHAHARTTLACTPSCSLGCYNNILVGAAAKPNRTKDAEGRTACTSAARLLCSCFPAAAAALWLASSATHTVVKKKQADASHALCLQHDVQQRQCGMPSACLEANSLFLALMYTCITAHPTHLQQRLPFRCCCCCICIIGSSLLRQEATEVAIGVPKAAASRHYAMRHELLPGGTPAAGQYVSCLPLSLSGQCHVAHVHTCCACDVCSLKL